MPTKSKIKIVDNMELRKEIDNLYEKIDNINIAKWSISMAKHILEITKIDYNSIDEIVNGFKINELWQMDEAKVHEIRQAGFKIHKLAKECDSEITKNAFRVVGHAVASAHMKEHAMVASDYSIKTIGLITSNDITSITKERKWQLDELKKF